MKNQITKILSAKDWQRIVIEENNDILVSVKETERLKIGLIKKPYDQIFLVRKTVTEKLYRAAEQLPEGLNLTLIEGYRTMQAQQESWDSKFNKLKLENPTWSDEEIDKHVRLVVARPAPLANHHCGGAIDVTLAYADGGLVDMGTPYPSEAMSAEWYKKFQMLSEEITQEQKDSRKILRDAMETEDFVWYPGEWWHYCFGDRMWAVYSRQPKCFYGPIEP
jgi:D-alanyl-D-alanine dipeptidase